MAKNIYDKLRKIEAESYNVDVNKYKPKRASEDRIVREFNKGRSFSFNKWMPLTKYSNDDFEQDFVTYGSALLACKKSHESSEEPKLIYDIQSGAVIGVESDVWEFVFASSIAYNNYYINDIPAEWIGQGLGMKDNQMYATSGAITLEPIKVNIDLGTAFNKGDIIPPGTPIQDILEAVFTSTHLGRSDGLPIYTTSMLNSLPKEDIPEKYISIPDEEELFEVNNESSYIDILFSAIRKLQAEVSRLRNSFKYGINSYSNKNTAMSEIINNQDIDEEPVWATDQSDLSGLASAMIDFEIGPFPFKPKENFITSPGKVTMIGEAYFDDPDSEIQNCSDPKLYSYTTTSNLNIKYTLTNESATTYTIDLASVVNVDPVEKYNVLFMVSRRTQKADDSKFVGFNYVWISIGDYATNRILAEGYYNPNSNSLSRIKFDIGMCTPTKVIFYDTDLYKFDMYSKYQDFSEEVNPSTPSDQDYKYEAAHITIRAVKDYDELTTIESKLPNNELIWDEKNRKLYIKSKNQLVAIGSVGESGGSGSGNTGNTGMSENEIIELLRNMGIVYQDASGLKLSDVSDVTFVNQDTGKKFKFEVSPSGELVGNEVITNTLESKLRELARTGNGIPTTNSFRGFIAKFLCATSGESTIKATNTKDVGVYADRVIISGVYCPLSTDVKFGCSHGFIEISNVSLTDIPLDGCYLHYLHPEAEGGYKTEHLALKGVLKAGSTYLVRCKKYADAELNADVMINVDTYDQEWYINGELLDLTLDSEKIAEKKSYSFALTYGNKHVRFEDGTIGATLDIDAYNSASGSEINENIALFSPVNTAGLKAGEKVSWQWYYIDSLVLNAHASTSQWAFDVQPTASNSIIKRTFALDPAKQAFNGCTTFDSSRYRNNKPGNDNQILDLSSEKIEFPNSDETYPISYFTPLSSKENKNVCTDKTKLDMEKPNMVTCAFGINTYTTRCFNWVSAGQFDEYVFIKDGDSWKAFESYKKVSEAVTQGTEYPRRKEFSVKTNNAVYARIVNTFPGCEINYTSHKCIIDLSETAATTGKQEFTYVVGRKTTNGTPDFEHCSEEMKFTLYSKEYKPKLYQTSDQQGFHWIEYQVWAAAAKSLNEVITADCKASKIMPILINTGDMTQNGTRVNEWLDYYNAGKCLFNHLEQMSVTGNNDLCGTNPAVLGTGDDIGKSNSFFFHVCYCYEVDERDGFLPIITSDSGIDRYVTSTYYFDTEDYRFLMCNSEFTYVNCRDWFEKIGSNGDVINIYTGWTVPAATGSQIYAAQNFTTVYTMLYNILNDAKTKSKETVVACHEIPFTVMTIKNHLRTYANEYRSVNESGSLVGSHMNQLSAVDRKGTYWFSRLMEQFGVRLCLGGHKHTYAVSFPIREYYFWNDNGTEKNSLNNPGGYVMGSTLENDDVIWTKNIEWDSASNNYKVGGSTPHNLTKHPIICSTDYNNYGNGHTDDTNYLHPRIIDNSSPDYKGVVYFMCQATGYKLTSNKELPAPYQEFSRVIPKTDVTGGKETASNNQKHPMFAVVDFYSSDNITIDLVAIRGIFNSKYKFTQLDYGTEVPTLYYAGENTDANENNRFCGWGTEVKHIITI